MDYLNPFLDRIIPLKLDYGLRIPSATESGIFQDWLGKIWTKTEDLANLPVKLGRVAQGEAIFTSVLCNPRLFLAKISSQLYNESEGQEKTTPNCPMNLD